VSTFPDAMRHSVREDLGPGTLRVATPPSLMRLLSAGM
jgi:hypothetical protein